MKHGQGLSITKHIQYLYIHPFALLRFDKIHIQTNSYRRWVLWLSVTEKVPDIGYGINFY